jgi:hypothetical protein
MTSSTGHKFTRFTILGALVFGAAAACSAPAPKAEPVASGIANAESGSSGPRNSRALGHFTATFDGKTKALSFAPVGRPIVLDDNLQPLSEDGITVSQSGGGNGQPTNTVDLVSTGCVNTYPTGNTFQCTVNMRSYYNTRSIANVYAQIDSVTVGGTTYTTTASPYDSNNSDTDSTYNPPLSNLHGLWAHQNTSTNGSFLSANDGSNGGNGNGNNQGSRIWEFKNPGNLAVSYDILVWASLGYSNYASAFGPSYVDACSGGTTVTTTSKSGIPLPFDFMLFSSSALDTVNIAYNGQITFGSTHLTNHNPPIALPSTSSNVPRPVIFPFWDDLKYGAAAPAVNPSAAAGEMCYQTLGTAPSRQFVVEWRNMTFANAPGLTPPCSLDFEVLLYEGTGEIDTVYNYMDGTTTGSAPSNGRETGTQATFGFQDSTGTLANQDATNDVGNYSSGTSNAYIGVP